MKIVLLLMPLLFGFLAAGSVPTGIEKRAQLDLLDSARHLAMETCNHHYELDLDHILDSLSQFQIPNESTFKCWYNCFMKQMGLIQGKKIVWDLAKYLTKMQLMDDQYDQKVDNLYTNCEAEIPHEFKDQCQMAYEFILCEARNWLRVGLPLH